MIGHLFCLFLALLASCLASKENPTFLVGHLTAADLGRLKGIFIEAPSTDPASVHYAIIGLKALGHAYPKESEACNLFKKHLESDVFDVLYHSVAGSAELGAGRCKIQLPKMKQLLEDQLKGKISIDRLYSLITMATSLGEKVDIAVVTKLLTNLKKEDPSASTLAYAFYIASMLSDKALLKSHFADIEDVIEQADEADGTYLYYQNGLYTTSLVVDSIFQLAKAQGQAPKIPETKLVKLANFLYTRRHTAQLRSAAHLAIALRTLSSNSFMVPISISGEAGIAVTLTSGKPQLLKLRLTDILGAASPADTTTTEITAGGLYEGAERKLLGATNRGPFKAGKEKTVFELALSPDHVPSGNYWLQITGKPKKADTKKKLLGLNGVQVPLHVMAGLKVEKGLLTLRLSDNSRSQVEHPLTLNQKVISKDTTSGSLRLDQQAHLSLSMQLVDSLNGLSLKPHQVFVQWTHSSTKQAVTYLGEYDKSTGAFKFSLSVGTQAATFEHLSGVYAMELIVGDALLTTPIKWHMADIDLHFATDSEQLDQMMTEDPSRMQTSTVAGSRRARGSPHPMIGNGPTKPKPALIHTFRTPEPRASSTVAMVFTIACLLPLLSLLVAWIALRVNISNIPCSLSGLIFHIGMIGIFALYFVYWLRLDMFTTLRYLGILGVITFIAGNRLLRQMVAQRKAAGK